MNRILIMITGLALVAGGCGNSGTEGEQDMAAKIAELEPKLMNDTTFTVDYQVAKELIPAYTKLVKENPQDPNSPDYIFKAAEISQGLGQGNLAVKYYDQFLQDYSDNKRAAIALFQKAFVYETIVGNKEMAVKTYEEFLEKYPDHELAPSAQYSIVNIDKSPEDLIKEFKSKGTPES